jgi:hypothetical protein
VHGPLACIARARRHPFTRSACARAELARRDRPHS